MAIDHCSSHQLSHPACAQCIELKRAASKPEPATAPEVAEEEVSDGAN